MTCGNRGGGRGVPSCRLQQDVRVAVAPFLQLLGHEETVFLVAYHHGVAFGDIRGAVAGLLQHGDLGDQGPELLGMGLAGNGPQARARTAGEYHWDHVSMIFLCCGHDAGMACPYNSSVEDTSNRPDRQFQLR